MALSHYPGCDEPAEPTATDAPPPGADAESERPKEGKDEEHQQRH